MKKLLVLMLVLGMASTANAIVLSWGQAAITIPSISATVVVGIDSDTGGSAGLFDPVWVGATTTLVSQNIVPTSIAGTQAQAIDFSSTAGNTWWTVQTADTSMPIGDSVESGKQYDVTIKGLVTGDVTLAIYGFGDNSIDVTVVPEPMTVALLGLGSMFLLRRRKK